jgi:hypothetical protein
MEFSREVYQLIVRHAGTRSDLLSLCLVSRDFQREAEKALYNTLHLRGQARTISVCDILSRTSRLALHVEALSLYVEGSDGYRDEEDRENDSSDESRSESSYGDEFWDAVAASLRQTNKLRFLSVYLERISDTARAWILDGCTFQLLTFHSDFEWDSHLDMFLRSQTALNDVYLVDYRALAASKSSKVSLEDIHPSLPALSTLECSFSEAVVAFAPRRPLVRVKTCFSRVKVEEKRVELRELLDSLQRSQKPLRALDLADESYDSAFTRELVTSVSHAFSANNDLRYLGTLVFPVGTEEASCLFVLRSSCKTDTSRCVS